MTLLVFATVGLDSDGIYCAVVFLRPIGTLSWLLIQLSSEPINNSGLQGFCEELGFPYFFFLGKKKKKKSGQWGETRDKAHLSIIGKLWISLKLDQHPSFIFSFPFHFFSWKNCPEKIMQGKEMKDSSFRFCSLRF